MYMSIQYSDTTNKSGIIQLIEFYTALGDGAISGNSTLLKRITALANIAMSEVWHKVWYYQAGWQYDDSNQTDLPQGNATLTAGVSKYALPSEAMTVNRVEILDDSNFYYKLYPITERQIAGGIDELLMEDGLPQYYRIVGRTIELFPAPSASSVTLTNGLKVYFDRAGVVFESTDTTQTPGFSAEYHDIIPTKVAIKWLQVHKPDSPTLALLQVNEINRMKELEEFESNKFKDLKPLRMTGAPTRSR